MKVGDTPHVKMEKLIDSSDVPDSATTLRDPIFHDIKIDDDQHIKTAADDIEPPQNILSLDRSSPSNSDEKVDKHVDAGLIERETSQAKHIWKFRLRPVDDDEPEDWWFASTGIPLLAATLGPMANVFSIAALVSPWRAMYTDPLLIDDTAIGYPDANWCVVLNAVSLAFGFGGNFFLLFNFTQAVRYIVALPVTIILWFFATGILTSITICTTLYAPPRWPEPNYIGDVYTEAFWYAVIASVLYFICSTLLMINMLGYFLGHYAQHFELDDDQRNLILQTMMFFLWLAGGAGVFARVNGWTYSDALYFADVTILTIGFGDFYSTNDLGRGMIFPYSVGGIIILGLVVSSISRFATQLGHEKVIKKKLDQRRIKTLSLTVTNSAEKEEREEMHRIAKKWRKNNRPKISAPFDPRQRSIVFDVTTSDARSVQSPRTMRSAYSQGIDTSLSPKSPQSWVSGVSDLMGSNMLKRTLSRSSTMSFSSLPALGRFTTTSTKIKMLRDERDRFNEMRSLQDHTRTWKKYVSLLLSITAFSILWCGGALIFHLVEEETYFEALYFCYVSLLTIGYGDFAPKSNPGKPFFVLWSLCAIPTMTILISNMGDTIIASYKRGTFRLGDVTLLPKKGFVKALLNQHPRVQKWIGDFVERKQQKERLEMGFPVGPDIDEEVNSQTRDAALEELATVEALDEHDLAQKLVDAIRDTANHLRSGSHHHYTYEEWVEYTRLIRFSQFQGRRGSTALLLDEEERDEGIIEWDWIGEDSPMMSNVSETEWILDRLTESLDRYMKHQIPELKKRKEIPRRRRRSGRGSMSMELERMDNRIEETGFMPVKLTAPEGPRRRANSSQRTAVSPTRSRSVSLQANNRLPLTDGADDETACSSSREYVESRSSAISTQIAEGKVGASLAELPPLDPPYLQRLAVESGERSGTGINHLAHGSNSASGGARRHTLAARKGKQTQKYRMGSGDGMQSLTAMRLRRQH